jgi:hypothetical protein
MAMKILALALLVLLASATYRPHPGFIRRRMEDVPANGAEAAKPEGETGKPAGGAEPTTEKPAAKPTEVPQAKPQPNPTAAKP